MTRKISIVLFWTLIVLSIVGLTRMTWQDWRGSLRMAAFVAPFVLFTFWLESRFAAEKRWIARIMIGSAVFALGSGSILAWDLKLYRAGFEAPGDSIDTAVATAVCIVSSLAFVWSLCGLMRRASKMPT
jgi:hypothetical protein